MPLSLSGCAKHALCVAAFSCVLVTTGKGRSNAQATLDQDLLASVYLHDIQASESVPSALPFSLPNCSDGSRAQRFPTLNTMLEINGLRVLVDFIVNAQGRVESPLILEGSGEANEQLVLSIIQQWRFRPVVCNGVPTNVELRVLFIGPRKRLPHPTASIGRSTQRIRVINGRRWS